MTKEVRGWIYRFFWFSAFLAMSLALVTFNKEQNHFFNGKWPIEQQSSNELGILGSWIAGFLLSFLVMSVGYTLCGFCMKCLVAKRNLCYFDFYPLTYGYSG